jgi:hypothetical protein
VVADHDQVDEADQGGQLDEQLARRGDPDPVDDPDTGAGSTCGTTPAGRRRSLARTTETCSSGSGGMGTPSTRAADA